MKLRITYTRNPSEARYEECTTHYIEDGFLYLMKEESKIPHRERIYKIINAKNIDTIEVTYDEKT